MLSLAGGAESAGGPAGDAPKKKAAPVITLGEEEILDVSLSTFYVFDNENAEARGPHLQLAQRRVYRGYRAYAACGGCGSHENTNGCCGGGVDNY
jgi:hypothetical protein